MTHDQDARGWKARAEQAEKVLAEYRAQMQQTWHWSLKARAEQAEKKAEAAEARLAEVEKALQHLVNKSNRVTCPLRHGSPINMDAEINALYDAQIAAERALAADNSDKAKTFTLAADSAAPSKPEDDHFIHEWDHGRTVCMSCGAKGDGTGGVLKGDTGEQGGES